VYFKAPSGLPDVNSSINPACNIGTSYHSSLPLYASLSSSSGHLYLVFISIKYSYAFFSAGPPLNLSGRTNLNSGLIFPDSSNSNHDLKKDQSLPIVPLKPRSLYAASINLDQVNCCLTNSSLIALLKLAIVSPICLAKGELELLKERILIPVALIPCNTAPRSFS
jgi:hypothetical protein